MKQGETEGDGQQRTTKRKYEYFRVTCYFPMLLPRLRPVLRPASLSSPRNVNNAYQRRLIFNFFRKNKQAPAQPGPILAEDNLFHPFSKSPFPPIRARGKAIEQLAPCPVCAGSHTHVHAHTQAQPRAVKFECPDCGWPSHCSEEHWKEDAEHQKYCQCLREANEDEHDLRSGRRLREFELPGEPSVLLSLYREA